MNTDRTPFAISRTASTAGLCFSRQRSDARHIDLERTAMPASVTKIIGGCAIWIAMFTAGILIAVYLEAHLP